MIRLARSVLCGALCLLTSAATAHAECAWLLWIETEAMSRHPAGQWKSASFDRNIHETRKSCDETLVRRMEGQAQFAGVKVFRRDEDSSSHFKDRFMLI